MTTCDHTHVRESPVLLAYKVLVKEFTEMHTRFCLTIVVFEGQKVSLVHVTSET